MKISIVINNFNYEPFVGAAIESALGQTQRDCEVIVVDDGSTDNSRAVLEHYRGRVQLVFKRNGGQASALNAGFRAASGDLIAFLDADDALFPFAIETAASAWQPGVSKVQFPLEILDPSDRPTGLVMPRETLDEGSLVSHFLETGRYVTAPTSGNLFAREFLAAVCPIPEMEWSESGDGYLNTCAPFYGRVAALAQPLGFYRIHGASMSSVAHNGSLHLAQLEKLMRHAVAERNLLGKLAGERGLALSQRAVFSHWMHLKLKIALDRLSRPAGPRRFAALSQAAVHMAASVVESPELSRARKAQHVVWAFGVAALPSGQAAKFIEYAFDRAPTSRFARFLRRM